MAGQKPRKAKEPCMMNMSRSPSGEAGVVIIRKGWEKPPEVWPVTAPMMGISWLSCLGDVLVLFRCVVWR